jgi:hypothetical protein
MVAYSPVRRCGPQWDERRAGCQCGPPQVSALRGGDEWGVERKSVGGCNAGDVVPGVAKKVFINCVPGAWKSFVRRMPKHSGPRMENVLVTRTLPPFYGKEGRLWSQKKNVRVKM